jgi:hypothetical protein
MKYAFFFLMLFLFACNPPSSNQNTSQGDAALLRDSVPMMTVDSAEMKRLQDSATKADDLANENKLLNSTGAWQYHEKEDALTSKKVYHAVLQSDNSLYLNAPYDGGTECYIDLRNKDGENDVIIAVTKGQFLVDVVDGETIKVRFDSSAAETYSCSGPADYNTTTLYVNDTDRFISRLKKAKKVLIRAGFYDNGLQDMEFFAKGLEWKH